MATTPPVSSIPLFGRRWSVIVQTQSGEQINYSVSDFDPNALRVTFDIETYAIHAIWKARIKVWNLDQSQAQAAVSQGDEIQVNAGYQTGDNYGLIFQGKIYQVLYDKVGGVDYTIEFLCIATICAWYKNFAATSYPAQTSQMQVIKQMIANSQSPSAPLVISDADSQTLSNLQSPRGGVVFGPISKYMNITVQGQQNWVTSFDGTNLQIGQIVGQQTQPDFTYAPFNPKQTQPSAGTTNSLIGAPRQTQLGANFRVLLDARLKCQVPGMLVKLDQSIIQQLPGEVVGGGPGGSPTTPFILPINSSFQYFVIGLRHTGDTRGGPWYTDVTSIDPTALALAATGNS
jgi:hypothetical protein